MTRTVMGMEQERTTRALLAGTAALLLVGGAGCYERTVSSRGLGSSRGPVEPVYRSETGLDHAFDSLVGDKPPSTKPSWRAMPDTEVKAISTGEKRPQ